MGNTRSEPHVVIVGAGIGGLSAALLLRARGAAVTIVERHSWVGGKLRSVPSDAGPVDAGPTVLTLRRVFDAILSETDAALGDYVRLEPEPVLARHFWPDGSTLDLFEDRERSIDAVEAFAGGRAAREFRAFADEAQTLFETFDAPMMRTAEPKVAQLGAAVMRRPRHLPTLLPGRALSDALAKRFTDPRLRQLFGRYATYVGGSPLLAPSLLLLICHAEAAGVWRVPGGLHLLAEGLARRFTEMGGAIRLNAGVAAVEKGASWNVHLEGGERLTADAVVFNGDPRALTSGRLGPAIRRAARDSGERSLSARVWSFASPLRSDLELSHHNVFFAEDAVEEFNALANGQTPTDPTIYVCAQDRGSGTAPPDGAERFEIILNAAPLTAQEPTEDEVRLCRQTTFETLARFGLTFETPPPDQALATPTTYEALFPASAGALYGQSPHGTFAALSRPRARTTQAGLYLSGGGAHPGPGLPMAALSGRHAAEAALADLGLT